MVNRLSNFSKVILLKFVQNSTKKRLQGLNTQNNIKMFKAERRIVTTAPPDRGSQQERHPCIHHTSHQPMSQTKTQRTIQSQIQSSVTGYLRDDSL